MRITPLFAVGIFVADAMQYAQPPGLWLVALISLALLFYLAFRPISYRYRWVFGLTFSISLLIWGYARTSYYQELQYTDHWTKQLGPDSIFSGIMQIKHLKVGAERLQIELRALQTDQHQSVSGNAYLQVSLDKTTANWQTYDKIFIQAQTQRLKKPPNPHAFDFSDYLAKKNIHFQLRANTATYQKVASARWSFAAQAQQWRYWALQRLQSGISRPREFSVAAALILGHRDGLEQEVRSAYAETGAIHVLAVSGLHVGIMAQMLGWFLLLLPQKSRMLRYIRLMALLVAIWGFAFLTGLSASVSRAAMMFSLIAIGDFARGRHHIYNTLAASALILLLYNPLWLFDVGFQLSYLAVLGIVFFQPLFYRAVFFPNRILTWLWALLSVALAAQLATFPLSLYYFHQFPLYFWLSGLIVPLIGPILALGIFTILLGNVPLLGSVLAWILSLLLLIVNSFIYWIHQLPGGLWEGIWLTPGTLILLIVIVITFGAFLRLREAKYVLLGLGASGLLLWQGLRQQYQHQRQQEIVVYQAYRNTLIDFIDGQQLYSISSLLANARTTSYLSHNNRIQHGVPKIATSFALTDTISTAQLWYNGTFGQFAHCTFAIVHEEAKLPTYPVGVDLLIVTQSRTANLQEWRERVPARHIIHDGSNPPWRIETWADECEQAQLDCYFTTETGAFRYVLPGSMPTF